MTRIRPYRELDLPQIINLVHQNLREINSKVYPAAVIDFMIQRYSEVGNSNGFQTYRLFSVIEDEATLEIQGCAGWKKVDEDPHKAYLSSMFIKPKYHHQGLGRALLDAVIAHARSMKCNEMICGASLNAIDFYTKLGFQPLGLKDAGPYGQVMEMRYVFN